ncbi:MAG: malto-oligosyltrehalose trehalohydrolase, partial [Oscillochloris sp.]|nr:malto-oligosyltrehalose trehalohydrolase [Oscillochloris sp.]
MHEHPRGRIPAYHTPPGATYLGDGRTTFTVWAPLLSNVELSLLDPSLHYAPMERDSSGYWRATLEHVPPGTRYRYRLDGHDEFPDPASRWQPEGVHGPSAVLDPQFAWTDSAWFGIPLRNYVIYELHVGTFTAEGTFEAIISQLPQLKELGVTAIELMPVAHFPGQHNWGYDGVYLYAPHTAYGGAVGLKRLVDACHAQGIAVVLDVVYNHVGPEGNYLWSIARPFFTDHYRTPWGDAINYDGPHSDPVRHFIIANALYWLREYHIDALRLDAVHAIYDFSAYHLLEELADTVLEQAEALNRRAYLIAESDQNDPRLIRMKALGGYAIDSQWADDFHHALHVLLTGEQAGYYTGFGELSQLARAYRQAYVFAGDYAPNRSRRFGRLPQGCRPEQFVVCTQNHDQVGNRALGDRLATMLSFAQLKLAAGAFLLSPFTPLLFMGEEYAELAPFQFFTDHSDPALVRGVREGRKAEFAAFVQAHAQALPDPQDPATFARSKLDHSLRERGRHAVLRTLYRELLRLRRELPALRQAALGDLEVDTDEVARTLT